jgi:branched-chain amino acid transport system ATP-binding protein
MSESLPDSTQLGATPNSGADAPTADAAPSPTRPAATGTVDPVTANVLYADHITIKFGGLTAVDDVSFAIPPKSIVSLIGPNGAGKTTFFNVLTGLYQATEGTVFLNGRDVTLIKPHLRAAMGMARTFQNIRLFNLMTAEENVMVAMHPHLRSGVAATILRLPRQHREEREARDTARELLEYVGIGHAEGELARNLSYGDQRRLEIARAMALRPKVLLLDEPTAGMNPQESATFNDFVHRVRDEKDISVLLIEHDMSVIMKISERITVLDRGVMIAEGTPDDIRSNQTVIEAYLGKTGTREGKRNKT